MGQYNLLKAACFNPNSLEEPMAWVGHLPFAYWLIKELHPKRFVELGTHTGNSYFTFCQSIKEDNITSECYAIDTWEGDEHAGKYTDEIFDQVNNYNIENYSQFSKLMRMRFDQGLEYFKTGSIDLLHIDGLHTYEAVKHDFESWLPKLAHGAIVIFHDTHVKEREFGVWRLWEELKQMNPSHLEFKHSHGLGVIQISPHFENDRDWLKPDSFEQNTLIGFFERVGEEKQEKYKLLFQVKNLQSELSELKELQARTNSIIKELNSRRIPLLNRIISGIK